LYSADPMKGKDFRREEGETQIESRGNLIMRGWTGGLQGLVSICVRTRAVRAGLALSHVQPALPCRAFTSRPLRLRSRQALPGLKCDGSDPPLPSSVLTHTL